MPDVPKVLRWEEPPRSGQNGGGRQLSSTSRYSGVAEELRARPGEWAVIYDGPKEFAAALPTHIRAGALLPFTPAGDFDACSRTKGGQRTVYARFLGDGGCE